MKTLVIIVTVFFGCITVASAGNVPEPLTMLLFGSGLIGLTTITRRSMKKK